jgi:hypothetical protein
VDDGEDGVMVELNQRVDAMIWGLVEQEQAVEDSLLKLHVI